ncbi:MAG: ParB/RepB/Spo0J family partition protein [Patescibacteria group bacterium]
MQKPSGLGRGLSSLIPSKKNKISDEAAGYQGVAAVLEETEKVLALPVVKISPNPHQPRDSFNEESLEELSQSIKEHGIIQPLIVTKIGEDHWQLIAGERRWRAAKKLGLETVPAIVRDLSEQKRLELALIENLQREDLNALEVAKAYQKLIDQFNLSQHQLARRVGKSRPAVSNTLRILGARTEVKEAIISGKITAGHARALVALPSEDQMGILDQILNNKWNVRESEKATKEVVIKKHLRRVSFDPELKAQEEALEQYLGTKVEIKKHGGQGQIIVRFFSEEELSDILGKII